MVLANPIHEPFFRHRRVVLAMCPGRPSRLISNVTSNFLC